ncbi:hypothetical protein [Streptomyces lunaelactis]|uniref:hypothetical protein n=1 Tax=Streptomyces lunaelactis TaxID=1535768 RepID=UPI0015846E8B|nr:hypothetical protein [Streptomyces lunaelactis]NUK03224.1 hypothetical protein [Streptomyces lunaelactis]NUK18218.1 hypothetical protein [Streptomyces lunaelactis]
MRNVEDQVTATSRARETVRRVLEQVPYGTAGRERMLDIVYELRDDPRAIAGGLALTAAALREVAVQQGRPTRRPGSDSGARHAVEHRDEDDELPGCVPMTETAVETAWVTGRGRGAHLVR